MATCTTLLLFFVFIYIYVYVYIYIYLRYIILLLYYMYNIYISWKLEVLPYLVLYLHMTHDPRNSLEVTVVAGTKV